MTIDETPSRYAHQGRAFLKNLFLPRKFSEVLGYLTASLSIISLINDAFQYGLSFAFGKVIDYYNHLVDGILGWLQPHFATLIERFATVFDLSLTLYPHWKHILVLLGIYFFRDAHTKFSEGLTGSGIFQVILSAIVALAASIGAGLVPLAATDMAANFTIAAIPIASMWVFDALYLIWHTSVLREHYAARFGYKATTWSEFYFSRMKSATLRLLIGQGVLAAGLQIPLIRQSESPGLAMLAVLVFVLAIYWLLRGYSINRRVIREGKSEASMFWETGSAKFGMAILRTFVLTAAFLAMDAGF